MKLFGKKQQGKHELAVKSRSIQKIGGFTALSSSKRWLEIVISPATRSFGSGGRWGGGLGEDGWSANTNEECVSRLGVTIRLCVFVGSIQIVGGSAKGNTCELCG